MRPETWIRFGALPTVTDPWGIALASRNHADGFLEGGVSVYTGRIDEDGVVWLDLVGVDGASALFIIDPSDVWIVTAERVIEWTDPYCITYRDTGSDGEPLVEVAPTDRDTAARRITPSGIMVRLIEDGPWIKRY